MKRKKLTRKTLAELSKQNEVLSVELQKTFIGGGNGTFHSPYTFEEYKHYGGGSGVYYINGSGMLSYNLSEVEVVGHRGGYSGNSGAPVYSGGSWENIGKAADGFGLDMSVKEAIIGLVNNAELGKAGSRYLTFTKWAGRACGGIGVLIAVQDEMENFNTRNTIKLAISISSLALGPAGNAIYCVVDMAGGVDYISDTIAKKIEELTSN